MLDPATEDANATKAGFQFPVVVTNANVPKPAVTLEIRAVSDATLVYRDTSAFPVGGSTTRFDEANFSSGGVLALVACATDSAGNTGCSADGHEVTVLGLPTVMITSPVDGSAVTEADDCDGGTAGLQVAVEATTDALAGSTAVATISGGGSNMLTVPDTGLLSFCVSAPAGDADDIPVTVEVTNALSLTASATVFIDIDTSVPASAINDLSFVVLDRRQPSVRFTWTAVADGDGSALDRYELRCGRDDITDETLWDDATVVGPGIAPAAPGNQQSFTYNGFLTGFERFCQIRAFDPADRATPLPGSATQSDVPFLEHEITASSTNGFGQSTAPIGDVNGDGIDDFVIGAPSFTVVGPAGPAGAAYVYFGSSSGLAATPAVTITGGTHSSFGLRVVGLGDFNGDDLNDFAVAERGRGGGIGSIYVFFGRATDTWPSSIDVSAGGCGADVCFNGTDAGGDDAPAILGASLRAADFDGDGVSDLIAGAPFIGGLAGRVYVLLGSGSGFTANAQLDVPIDGAPITPSTGDARGFFIDAPATAGSFGQDVVSPGNIVSGAGADLIISETGGPENTVYQLAGRSYSATMGLEQISTGDLSTVESNTSQSAFGVVLGSLDFNGDGLVDLIAQGRGGGGSVNLIFPDGRRIHDRPRRPNPLR